MYIRLVLGIVLIFLTILLDFWWFWPLLWSWSWCWSRLPGRSIRPPHAAGRGPRARRSCWPTDAAPCRRSGPWPETSPAPRPEPSVPWTCRVNAPVSQRHAPRPLPQSWGPRDDTTSELWRDLNVPGWFWKAKRFQRQRRATKERGHAKCIKLSSQEFTLHLPKEGWSSSNLVVNVMQKSENIHHAGFIGKMNSSCYHQCSVRKSACMKLSNFYELLSSPRNRVRPKGIDDPKLGVQIPGDLGPLQWWVWFSSSKFETKPMQGRQPTALPHDSSGGKSFWTQLRPVRFNIIFLC